MSSASIQHTIAIMSVLNRVIKENDGSVTHFHLGAVSSKIMETPTAKERVEQILEKLQEGINTAVENGESKVDIDGYMSMEFRQESDGIILCTVNECPYRKWCNRILPMVIKGEELMVLPCTVLMECCLQDSQGGVCKVRPGEDTCEIEVVLKH
ncbi:hypothetical protein [Methanopyrus sp.]